jgi:hypothetical protein
MIRITITIIAICMLSRATAQQNSFLFNTPLSFYNTDILSYLQVLHKNQQYEKMVPFFTGELRASSSQSEFVELLSNAPFGYSMKRAGIREVKKGEVWSLTYQRTILGTQETFKVDCKLTGDTCRIILDLSAYKLIFPSSNIE